MVFYIKLALGRKMSIKAFLISKELEHPKCLRSRKPCIALSNTNLINDWWKHTMPNTSDKAVIYISIKITYGSNKL